MNVESMRREISKVYPRAGWKLKVKRMPDAQVMAIYYNFLKNNRFEQKIKQKQEKKPKHKQLTFFDEMIFGYDESSDPDCSCELEYDKEGKVRSYNYIEGGK